MKATFTSPLTLALQFDTKEELSALLHVATSALAVAMEVEDVIDVHLPDNPGVEVTTNVLAEVYAQYRFQFPRT